MGQNKSKQYELSLPTRVNGIFTINVKEKFKYPSIPKEKEVNEQLKKVFNELLLTKEQENQVIKLPLTKRWKLICRFFLFIEKNNKEKLLIRKKTNKALILIENLKEKPTLLKLSRLKFWLGEASIEDLNSFFYFDGGILLLDLLEIAEVCSRTTKNYSKNLEILKSIQILINHQEGIRNILKISNSIEILFFNFNSIHVEISSIVLEILEVLIWNSNEAFSLILQALKSYRVNNNLKHIFQPFFHILEDSKNCVFIENVIAFINSFINSNCEEKERSKIKSDILSFRIYPIFEVIYIFIFYLFFIYFLFIFYLFFIYFLFIFYLFFIYFLFIFYLFFIYFLFIFYLFFIYFLFIFIYFLF